MEQDMSYCSICFLPRRNKRSDMCSMCEKGGTVERKFIEEVRGISGDVEDPIVEVEVIDTGVVVSQPERVLAPDSDNESSSLLEQVMTLQGNEEKLRDAFRLIDTVKEENARHLVSISKLKDTVTRKEGAKKQILARLQEEIEKRETEERRRKYAESMGRHYEASAQGYADECKQLRLQLEQAQNEIKKLNQEVDLDIPSMLKEIEELKQTIEKRDRAITHREKAYKEIASRNGALVVELEQVKQQLKELKKKLAAMFFERNHAHQNSEDLKQKLADCEKQRDEAEKGYGEREALAGEIHRLRRERADMILWGKETWKKVEDQTLEIAACRKELEVQKRLISELEVAEAHYLVKIRGLETSLSEGLMTPATSPITTPDAPLRRSSSLPLPSRCLLSDKRSREDEDKDENNKSPRSKKQLKF
jgi:DNA repair exonuclease SbcCD ATPase subunit